MNVLILCGELLFTCLIWIYLYSVKGPSLNFANIDVSRCQNWRALSWIQLWGGWGRCRAAELPTVMGTFIASVAITPCPKNPPHNFAVQFGQQFLHFCKNDFNHRLMCDGCADSSWIWRLGSWRNRAFHDKTLALAEIILEILRNGEKIRGFERERVGWAGRDDPGQ